jgi:hypothetical protein
MDLQEHYRNIEERRRGKRTTQVRGHGQYVDACQRQKTKMNINNIDTQQVVTQRDNITGFNLSESRYF